ncbi:hypothetical protein E2C01_031418 [Portunus trituberculatus]|uniref:Uncharacterized protein n=1 Tax=Portunus trituberculatus TaxID=210409 RepID=A0A5B7F016_PORTR|nr:hypothetical protein [Portunus trituberculatus]
MTHKMHLFSPKKSQEIMLSPIRPSFSIEAMVGGNKIKSQTSSHM